MKEQFNPTQVSEVSLIGNLRRTEHIIGQQDRIGFVDTLLSSVRRSDFFAGDLDDEFTIVRESSERQGIFKVWAPHIIPFLDIGEFGGTEIIEKWCRDLEVKPLSLHESLEQWRAFSEIFDRRLQQVFSNREVPKDAENAVVELFLRMNMAFAFASPFYNLEALVADSRESRFGNPINVTETIQGGGKLDAVALMLPSALADHVSAERLTWNNLTWGEIQKSVSLMRENFLEGKQTTLARQFILINKIASMAGVEADEVVFAANALQFIPANVGGKKEDMVQDDAINALTKLLEEPMVEINTNLVARDINALIRFLNWFPAIKSSENFQGRFWMYDAVCATANNLLGIIKNNPSLFFDREFSDVFVRQLSSQLDGLDATSAKGRFLLQLLAEGKFNDQLTKKIEERFETFSREILFALQEIRQTETLVDVLQCLPTFLVGGKADGLRKAMQVFGHEVILGGKVVTSEAVNEWLATIEGIKPLIQSLDSPVAIQEKLKIGEEIVQRMDGAQTPAELIGRIQRLFGDGQSIVLRSSSFDEDVPLIGTAPGIYESVIDVDLINSEAVSKALKTVIASFFSEKAISFREFKGLRHKPIFAVLVQEFIDNVGGSVFINSGSIRLNIAQRPSMVNHHNGSFEELSISNGDEELMQECKFLSAEQAQKVIWIARKAEEVIGPCDIEFVVDPKSNRIKILQLRTLQHQAHPSNQEDVLRAPSTTINIDNLDSLPNIGDDSINIQIGAGVDLEKFQGSLFRWLTTNRRKITSITLGNRIPTTCHFANIVGCLGIDLRFFK